MACLEPGGGHEAARILSVLGWRRSGVAGGGARSAERNATVGFLGASAAAAAGRWVSAFVERLRELVWTEGRTVVIKYQWADGRNERMTEIAAQFVRTKIDVIVAQGTQAAQAAKSATTTVPIVFVLPGDPVGSGLGCELGATEWQCHRDTPVRRRSSAANASISYERSSRGYAWLAIMANPSNAANVLDTHEVQAAAPAPEVSMLPTSKFGGPRILRAAFATFKGTVDALYVPPDALINTNQMRINTLALVASPANNVRRTRKRRDGGV